MFVNGALHPRASCSPTGRQGHFGLYLALVDLSVLQALGIPADSIRAHNSVITDNSTLESVVIKLARPLNIAIT